MRIYLTGQVCIEADSRLVDELQFRGKQGRLVFAYLVCERLHPVTRDELAEVVWPGTLPAAWEAALSALISKLRYLLQSLGLPRGAVQIAAHSGCYQIHLPASTWVDREAAARALDEAEGALRMGDLQKAWGPANIVWAIARRPFLPDDGGIWAELQRSRLQELLVRGVECLAEISLRNGEIALAIQHASELVRCEPYRETGYQRLMSAHAVQGNRAEAIRVYERCRTLLREEVGVDPSPELEALYRSLTRSASPDGERWTLRF
jgi:SARP family transcriptional regulator, regulator of embCAB operon